MEDDVRKDETTDQLDDTTDRREFLKKAGAIGGGALAAIAGLASAAEAQPDIRTRPRANLGLGPVDAPISGPFTIKPGQTASVEDFLRAYEKAGDEAPWVFSEIMPDRNHEDWVAGAAIYELRQRFPDSPNVGQNLVVLFTTLAAGMAQARNDDYFNPRTYAALGSGCGDGCGSGCGSGCMSAVAGGFGCGNGCGNDCNGAEAAGLMCGGGCEATGLEQLSFDRGRKFLEGVRFQRLNMGALAAAMRNADHAYNQSGLASAPADKPDW